MGTGQLERAKYDDAEHEGAKDSSGG